MPEVSVIMPAHNAAAFIRQAVESVLAQSFGDWELIVVDDGSNDETLQLVRAFGARVTLRQQAQQGPSAARNHGLRHARGEYVAFLDADDLWHPEFLKRTVTELARQPDEVAGVCAGWRYVDRDGNALGEPHMMQQASFALRDFLDTNPFPIHAALVRRAPVVASGGFDAQISGAEDWDLWLRLSARGARFVAIEPSLADYRLHGMSNSRDPERMRAARMRTLEKFFAREDLSPDVRALRPLAVGRALVQNSAQFFAAQRATEAQRDFCEAVHQAPEVLRDDETYYALICAEQPVWCKGTGQLLDLAAGERRVLDALRRATEGAPRTHARWRARPFARAYFALARLAYAQRSMSQARTYLRLAGQNDPALLRRRESLLLLAKSWLWRAKSPVVAS